MMNPQLPGVTWAAPGDKTHDFAVDLRTGKRFEHEVASLMAPGYYEVEAKDDSEPGSCPKTGNMFIETSCNGTRSGLEATRSDWWAHKLDRDTIVLITTDKLRHLAAPLPVIERCGQRGAVTGKLLKAWTCVPLGHR